MAAVHYHMGRFPPTELDWARLVPLIGPAHAAVAGYAGVLHGIPNAQVLLSPLLSREAVLSSRIEGTRATLGEVLEFEAGRQAVSEQKRGDILEVLNYRRAMRYAVGAMRELPLATRLICNSHEVLLQGVRGRDKTPGKFRRMQNWIGPEGGTLDQMRYVPPGPGLVADLISKWEKYMHGAAQDKLVQLAIVHAEFESIHPFLDGNGRLGRLLVPLFMVDKGLLASPDFYISAYLEAHDQEYRDRLLAVSRDDDWTGWCEFFLTALIKQAVDNQTKAKAILDLYQRRKDWIVDKTRSQYAVRALDRFFDEPVFKSTDFIKAAGIPDPSAKRILRVARDEGLMVELQPGRGRQPAVLMFSELFAIMEQAPDF